LRVDAIDVAKAKGRLLAENLLLHRRLVRALLASLDAADRC
jgi:hypothetical protein